MAFMTLNGLDVDVHIDDFDRSYEDIQSFERSEGMTLEGTLYESKRKWTFETPWEPSEAGAVALRDWVKGRGHYWRFDRPDGTTTRFDTYSSEGGPILTNVTGTFTAKFGTLGATMASGGSSVASVTFGSATGPYSISVWRYGTAATYLLSSAVHDGSTLRYYSPATALTTAFAWMTITAASGAMGITLKGKTDAGVDNANILYDGLMILPYALTTTQIAARAARTAPEPNFPYIDATGDFLEDVFPITVKGFVNGEKLTQVVAGGTQNARMLSVTLVEK